MTIGENIKAFRTKKGLTQQQLADRTGLKDSAIRRYESGKIIPKTPNLHKIAKALDITIADLDEDLKRQFDHWNEAVNLEDLQDDARLWDPIAIKYGTDTVLTFNDFLSLDPEGREKASEYIDFLMQKHRKE